MGLYQRLDCSVINLNPGSNSDCECDSSETDIEYSSIVPDEDCDTQPL
jgi:hypothetical protein